MRETAHRPARPLLVISQPMYFPWRGLFEQIQLADIYVDYNDVQFSRGGFLNRVQIKTAQGPRWLTIPLQDLRLGQAIRDVRVDERKNWRRQHLDQLKGAYARAPHAADMIRLVESVFDHDCTRLGELTYRSMQAVLDYFPALRESRTFLDVASLDVPGSSTRRVLDICKHLGARGYLTGHGARHYLEHPLFDAEGVDVRYIDYTLLPYPQLHGEFTPNVSVLDLIAHCGQAGIEWFEGATVGWREFMQRQAATDGPST